MVEPLQALLLAGLLRTAHPACDASADPAAFDGKTIEDKLLIVDVSPHGFGYFSRYCDLGLVDLYDDSFPNETIDAMFREFLAPLRPGESGPRVLEAVVRGRIEQFDFGKGSDAVPPGKRWVIRVASISQISVAPEGPCAITFGPRWPDCSPSNPKE